MPMDYPIWGDPNTSRLSYRLVLLYSKSKHPKGSYRSWSVVFRAPTLEGMWAWINERKHRASFQRANGRRWIELSGQPSTRRRVTRRTRMEE